MPNDTVFEELQTMANKAENPNKEIAIIMAIYMLGFSTYNGFS